MKAAGKARENLIPVNTKEETSSRPAFRLVEEFTTKSSRCSNANCASEAQDEFLHLSSSGPGLLPSADKKSRYRLLVEVKRRKGIRLHWEGLLIALLYVNSEERNLSSPMQGARKVDHQNDCRKMIQNNILSLGAEKEREKTQKSFLSR